MTPDQLAKSGTEHGEQRALFQWLTVAAERGFVVAWAWADGMPLQPITQNEQQRELAVPCLKRAYAIPNGGLRDKITAAKLKHEGVKSGVPDVFLPLPCAKYAGLYVEMKRSADKATKRRAGVTSSEQDDWIGYLRSVGYACSVCFDWRSAARDIQSYVEMAKGLT